MGTAMLGSLLGSTALKSNLTGFGLPGDDMIDSGLTTESAVESSFARPLLPPPAIRLLRTFHNLTPPPS